MVEIVPRPTVAEGVRPDTAVQRRELSVVEMVDLFWQESTGAPPSQGQQALLHEGIGAVLAAADGGVA